MGSDLDFIEGKSEDYIFMTEDDKGNKSIVDFGTITNSGLAEILCRVISQDYIYLAGDVEKFYFMEKLCEKLGVKLKNSVKVLQKI